MLSPYDIFRFSRNILRDGIQRAQYSHDGINWIDPDLEAENRSKYPDDYASPDDQDHEDDPE